MTMRYVLDKSKKYNVYYSQTEFKRVAVEAHDKEEAYQRIIDKDYDPKDEVTYVVEDFVCRLSDVEDGDNDCN